MIKECAHTGLGVKTFLRQRLTRLHLADASPTPIPGMLVGIEVSRKACVPVEEEATREGGISMNHKAQGKHSSSVRRSAEPEERQDRTDDSRNCGSSAINCAFCPTTWNRHSPPVFYRWRVILCGLGDL
jgi:hypothetical protein